MDFSKQEDSSQSRELVEDFARKALQKKYHLGKKLSQDNLETVYLAQSSSNSVSTKYFIQQFTPQYASREQLAIAKNLFNQEANIVKNLGNHPQIPSIHDSFEIQGQFFVIQEFISGQSFAAELDDAKLYNEKQTIEFLNEILPVINSLHKNNYIHRDIKPNNLIINSVDKKIYLVDFNSIREKITPENLDSTGQFIPYLKVGTQGYMPMEQNLGKPQFCSDIYALGIVVIQALTGIKLTELTYDDNNNPVWHHLLINSSNYSPKFLDIIDTMVCCNYRKRYQGVIAILASLKQLNSPQEAALENTIIQQPFQTNRQFSENTQIINNAEKTPTNSEHTLIINNSAATSQAVEHTLIIKDNDIESTRIIDPNTIEDHDKNRPQDKNKSRFNTLAVLGVCLIAIAIILGLSISKNNRDSAPQNSSSLSLFTISN